MLPRIAFALAVGAIAGAALLSPRLLSAPDGGNDDHRYEPTANIRVDFGQKVAELHPLAFGMDESHYGGAHNLTNDAEQRSQLYDLGISTMRLDLGYATPGDPSSALVCHARGCDQDIAATTWVESVRAAGAEPVIKVRISTAMPQQYWASDAANTVAYLNQSPQGAPVSRWIIGNEPDMSGIDVATYARAFVDAYRAMKAIDPNILIGGPAISSYNREYLRVFLQTVHDSFVVPDFIDWHQYGRGGDVQKSDDELLSSATESYERNARDLRELLNSIYAADVAATIEIEVGEWNLSWSGDERQLTHFGSVWAASAIGHMIRAGAGGRLYADKNGALGALCEGPSLTYESVTRTCDEDAPMPVYHGIGMFTGESLFRRFGNAVVEASSSIENLEVYASDDPTNIVIINKDVSATRPVEIEMDGVSVTGVQVKRLGPDDIEPADAGYLPVTDGRMSYDLAPRTIYTFLVNP
jgi:hypothetical protein